LQKLATLITVVNGVVQQFKQNPLQVVRGVQVQHFTTGENFNTENGGGSAIAVFFYSKRNNK
jgi:hypothetical protein